MEGMMSKSLQQRPLYHLGGDFGNRTSIGFLRDGSGLDERRGYFTSFLAEIPEQEYQRFSVGTQTTLDPNEGEYLVTYQGKHFLVGKLAQQQGPMAIDPRGVADRYWSQHNLILHLNMIAALLSPRELRAAGGYNPADETYECVVRVSTGMPVSVYTTARAEMIRQAFTGVHRFSFNGYDYVVELEVGPIVMEGVAGLLLHGGTGKAKKAVIDCGYWSTEILRKENGQFVRDANAGDAIGIGMAFDYLKSTVAFDFGRELSEDEAQGLLLAHARQEPLPLVNLYGKPLDTEKLGKVAEAALAVPGVPLQQMVSSRLGSARGLVATDVDPVVFVGGSAYYLKRYVVEKVPHVKVFADPENANARGYCLLSVGYKDWKFTKLPTAA
jgi:hypothetical protein